MPILQCEGLMPNDATHVRSVMHWPELESVDPRRYFVAAELTNMRYRDAERGLLAPCSAGLLQDLIDAPSWQVLSREVGERTKPGLLAGHVLLAVFFTDLWKASLPMRGAKEASLSRGFTVVDYWAKTETGIWGTGERMPKKTKIKEAWKEYRDVAHLWAAVAMNNVFPYAPRREIFSIDHFPRFMETAAYLQCFATTFQLERKSKAVAETLLDARSSWLVDLDQFRPKMMFASNLIDLENSLLSKALKTHTAR